MDSRTHLVLVSGVAGSRTEENRDPKTFLTGRFPNCVIDEFSLVANSAPGGRLLYRSSSALLEQLRKCRRSPNSLRELPIVFLGHGLGAFVVKQALILATEQPRYRDIALYTSNVVFLGAPHRATRESSWELMCLRLILMSRPPPDQPVNLVQRLVGELDGVSASFRTISSSFDVVNIYELSKHPMLDTKCSVFGLQDATDIPCDSPHEELWQSVPWKPDGSLGKHMLPTRNGRHSLFYDFFRHMSLLDSQVHRLRPTFVPSAHVDWICDNEALKCWRSDPLVGVLRISGSSGSSSTAVAARILGFLLEQTELKSTVYLSFSFDKNNTRAHSPFGLYLSLCRQLLSSRPSYFQHISAVSKFLAVHDICTMETLWVMVRCLMKHLLKDQKVSVYCIIDGVDQCSTSQTEMISRMEEFVGPSKGQLKLLLSGAMEVGLESTCEPETYREITLEPSSENVLSAKAQHITDRISKLALENSAWDGLENLAIETLGALPKWSPYFLVELNMMLLEWTGKHLTRTSLKDRLQQQPTTLQEFYARAMGAINEENRDWITTALRWVAFAVRPLRPTELAVAVALYDMSGGNSWNTNLPWNEFSDLIRRDIVGDLKQYMVPLLKVEDNRVYFIHDTFRTYLLEKVFTPSLPQTRTQNDSIALAEDKETIRDVHRRDDNASGDSHCSLLVYCLEYLRSFGQRGAESFICEDGIISSFPTDWDLGLFSYACLQWPKHFRETTNKSEAQSYLLRFLQDDERVETWARLYGLLNPSCKKNSILLDSALKTVCSFGLVELVDPCISLATSSEELRFQMCESLDLASENGHDDVVRSLLNKNARSLEALGLAARGGFEVVVKTLLAVHPDLDHTDETRYAPLHHATCGGHEHIVSVLLENGASPNILTSRIPDDEYLTLTRERNRRTRRRNRSESDSDSDLVVNDSESSPTGIETDVLCHLAWSESALHLAVLTGQLGIAKMLLTNGANIHAESSTGYDPLKYAAIGGFPELVSLLLDHNSDGVERVSADKPSTADRNTALHLAVACGHYEVANILLQHSNDPPVLVQAANVHRMSPLHIAAREGYLSVLNLMLKVTDKKQDTRSIASTEKDDLPASATELEPREVGVASRRHTSRRSRRKSTAEPLPESRSRPSSRDPAPITGSENRSRSALELAAENGHYQVVRALLGRKAWSTPQDRAFGLSLAAKNGHIKVVKHLLGDDLIIATADAGRKTALHLAAEGGHSNILEELLSHPRLFSVDANANADDEITPLQIAARAGHVNAISVLLKHEADKDLVNENAKKALLLAAENGHLPCVEVLLRDGDGEAHTGADKSGKTALHLAAENGHMAVVKSLCAFQDILWAKDESEYTAFDLLVRNEDLKDVEEFIQILDDTRSCETDFSRGGMPLHIAASKGNMEILRLLLEKGWGTDVQDASSFTPLHIAVMDNFLPGVKLLLENSSSEITARDSDGRTVMHHARNVELVNHLLTCGAENDAKDDSGRTPLYTAAFGGHSRVVEALLNSTPKPDIASQDDDGWNALHAAYDSASITELLLKHNAKPNVLNDDGRTPLAYAIRWNYIETAQLLLGAGADPNLADAFENSPLFLAFRRENTLELLELLVDKGLNLFVKGSDGDTALRIAARKGKLPEVQYLVESLASVESSDVDDIYAAALHDCVSSSEFDPELAEIFVRRNTELVNKRFSPQSTALHAACSKGTVNGVRWLLDRRAGVNVVVGGLSPLCAAVESDKDVREKVDLLLSHGADVNLYGKDQATALQRATTSSAETGLVTVLLEKGADADLMGGDLDSPLNTAIRGWAESTTIDHLIAKSDISRPGRDGRLPIHIAAIADRVDVVLALVRASADPLAKDRDGRSAFIHGVANLSEEVVKYLLDQNYFDAEEVDTTSQTALIIATRLGRKAMVNLLLEQKCFSNAEVINAKDHEGKTAVVHAVALDRLDIIEKLVDKDASLSIVDCRDRSALYWAAREARMETVESIITTLEMGDDVPEDLWNVAVHGAIASMRPLVLEKLLEKEDVDIEYMGIDGWTPLYTAERYEPGGHIEWILQQETQIASARTQELKRPTRWHPQDGHRGLEMDSDGITLSVPGGTKFVLQAGMNNGTIRADNPMLPLYKAKVYYFEVKLMKVAEQGFIGVGFCEDKTPVDRALGWDRGSWAFHSDDGCVYENGANSWRGDTYADACIKAGTVIGCGVNFAKAEAFYTIDGAALGRAFKAPIRGKLYPAVTMEVDHEGWEVSVVFPGVDGSSGDFVYKEDLESESLTRIMLTESDYDSKSSTTSSS